MANAYSYLDKFVTPTTSINRNLINTVMAAKQQKFDANVQTVNNAIANFATVDLIREEDKQYLANNLSKVVDILDNTDDIDFSKSGVGSELTNYISKAIDQNVLEQAANTQSIRKYQTQVLEIKNKKPDLYAQQNDWFAKNSAGLNQYLSGQSNSLGSLSYTPYTDYNKDLDDNILKWAKAVGIDTFYEPGEVDGIKFMREGKELSKADVKRFVASQLNEKQQNQIFIDNSFGYKDASNEQLLGAYQNYHTDNLDRIRNEKAAAIAEIKSRNGSSEEISQVSKMFGEVESFHLKESKNSNKSRSAIIQYIGLEGFLDKTASAYADKEYTKIAPDANDIRRAELQLKRAKQASGKASTTRTATGTQVPGTLVPTLTQTEEREGLQQSALTNYETQRESLLGDLFKNNPEFAKRYSDLKSEDAKLDAIEIEIESVSSINTGQQANPALTQKVSKYLNAVKDLNVINDSYTNTIKDTADRVYQSMVEELKTQNPDLNINNLAKKYPKTVELLRTKESNLSEKDKEVVRFEYAQDLKNLRGISENAENAISNYIENQFQRVKDSGVQDPNAKSKGRIVADALGTQISNAFDIITSLGDEEVVKSLEESGNQSAKNIEENILPALGEGASDFVANSPLGFLARGARELFSTDTDLSDLDEEDLQLKDEQGNFITAQDFIKASFDNIESSISTQLSASERRAPRSFELVLDPVTAKNNPVIRRETAAFLASRGRAVDNNERLGITLNNQDGTALIKEVDKKEGAVVLQVMQQELPPSLLSKFQTKQDEWQFNAANPSAVGLDFNHSPFKDRTSAIRHIDNLVRVYNIPEVASQSADLEQLRKKFAPTVEEMFKGLSQRYGLDQDTQAKLNKLLLTSYKVSFVPDSQFGVYRYNIVDKNTNSKVYEGVTSMSTLNEGYAAANMTEYLMKYFNSELQ